MPLTPIVKLPNRILSAQEIQDRLIAHLEQLRRPVREAYQRGEIVMQTPPDPDDPADMRRCGFVTYHDKRRAQKRARRLVARQKAAAGLGHLKEAEFDKLEPLVQGVHMVTVKNEAAADEIAAKLHGEMPWMASATEAIWHQLRICALRGAPLRLGPLLLDGPPGVGKSTWARRLGDLLAAPVVLIDASKGGVGMELAGLERGWSSTQPGRPLEAIIARRIGNPIVVVDEICKSSPRFRNDGSPALAETLLSLLEPETARHWDCVHFRVAFDMSHLSWILTSNQLAQVPAPLRSRVSIVKVTSPGLKHLEAFTRIQGQRRNLSDESIDAVRGALRKAHKQYGREMSLREVNRMLALAESLQARPMLQ